MPLSSGHLPVHAPVKDLLDGPLLEVRMPRATKNLERKALWALWVSFPLPIVVAAGALLIGQILGCDITSTGRDIVPNCFTGGISWGHVVHGALTLSQQYPLGWGLRYPLLGIAGLVGMWALIYRSFPGKWQIPLGLLGIWHISLTNNFLGMLLSFYIAAVGDCTLGGFAQGSACYAFGVSMTNLLISDVHIFVGWFYLNIPLSIAVSVVYVIGFLGWKQFLKAQRQN
jgi:hypothetical protein